MKRRSLFILFSLLMVVAIVLTGCKAATEEATEAPEPTEVQVEPTEAPPEPTEVPPEPTEAMPELKTVIIGVTDEISSLDFSDAYSTHDWELMRNVNVALTDYIPGSPDIGPGVAKSWEATEGGLVWTFTLDTGWMYPDGSELVAADIVRTVERALALDGDIHGVAEAYVASVEAVDDQTLVFNLVNPRGDFKEIASMSWFMPIQEGVFPDDELVLFPEAGIWGVGPWQIVEYDVSEQVVLERNPNYKLGFEPTAPDRVIIKYFSDATSMALAVENGDIDISWRILGPPEIQRLSEVEGLTVHNPGNGGIRYIIPNHAMGPMMDKNARQALAYLIDRDEIVDRVMQGTVEPLYSMVPPGFLAAGEFFIDRYGVGQDIAAAEEVLAASGFSAENPLVFDLWYPPEHYGTHAAQIFQVLEEQFEATPFIQVNLQSQEWGTYVKACTNGEYEACYLGWFFDYPDTSNYLDPFADSAASDDMGVSYSNPEMDQYLRDAGAETDPDARKQLYTDAQILYAEDVVTIPIHFEPEFAVYRNDTVSSISLGSALIFDYELIVLK
jgi:peptide/nickel transport system substrate-binding protein